jgi:hypothetical protein
MWLTSQQWIYICNKWTSRAMMYAESQRTYLEKYLTSVIVDAYIIALSFLRYVNCRRAGYVAVNRVTIMKEGRSHCASAKSVVAPRKVWNWDRNKEGKEKVTEPCDFVMSVWSKHYKAGRIVSYQKYVHVLFIEKKDRYFWRTFCDKLSQ